MNDTVIAPEQGTDERLNTLGGLLLRQQRRQQGPYRTVVRAVMALGGTLGLSALVVKVLSERPGVILEWLAITWGAVMICLVMLTALLRDRQVSELMKVPDEHEQDEALCQEITDALRPTPGELIALAHWAHDQRLGREARRTARLRDWPGLTGVSLCCVIWAMFTPLPLTAAGILALLSFGLWRDLRVLRATDWRDIETKISLLTLYLPADEGAHATIAKITRASPERRGSHDRAHLS